MKKNLYETYKAAVEFLDLEDKLDRLPKTIDFYDFKILKKGKRNPGSKNVRLKQKPF